MAFAAANDERALQGGDVRDVVKFGVLVGLAAIFLDAVVAHGLWWQNDPYWTYWVTKTFLITTVFAVGTAFVGAGLWQGAGLTVVHTLVLEIYYEFFAPVGLPQEPQWLMGRDLWWPGFLVHYVTILAGYFVALWLWRRNRGADPGGTWGAKAAAIFTLGATVLVLLIDGVVTQGLLLQRWPGLTFFLQHLLVTAVLVFAWTAYVGYDGEGLVAGAVLLSLAWVAYGMYLGPVGLPFGEPVYMGYDELWFRSFPGALISFLAGLWIAARFLAGPALRVAGRGEP